MEIVVQILALVVPLVVILVVVYRLRRVARMVRDPEQLASLLSANTRDALEEAGIDSRTISLEDLETNQMLKQLVSNDLRAAVIRMLTRGSGQGSDASFRTTVAGPRTLPRSPSNQFPGQSPSAQSAFPSGQSSGPAGLPPPIDANQTADRVRNWILALVIGGAVAALALFWR